MGLIIPARILIIPARLLFVVLLGLGLAACGRRGPLELPPDAPQSARANAQGENLSPSPIPATPSAPNEMVVPSTVASVPAKPPINGAPVAPKRGFLLDPLL